MSKTIKKIIVVFTILCAMLLIVFSIELILINRDSESGGTEPSAQGSPPPGSGGDNDGAKAPDPGTPETANGNGDAAHSGGAQPPPPLGTRHERLMPGDSELVFYVQDELFEHTAEEQEAIYDIFTFRDGGTAALEIRFVFMPQGVSVYASSYLEVDFDVAESTVYGEEPISRSPLRGFLITGTKAGTTYESWIYTFSDPELVNLGISFIIYYQNEAQRSALYTILDTFEMTPG